jgi:hypothetical protein
MWRVNLQVDGLPVDALVASRYPRGLVLNLASDLAEVEELPSGDVEKLGPLLLAGNARRRMWDVDLIVVGFVAFAGEVDKLEDERSTSYNAGTSGEEVLADNVLEHRGFSG